ncbi:MAG: bifunctional folylpolyglutamate synthase/dihydrofolate synthase [Lactobacillaceae bacterium]|jgi:dihydrofolate synthase/folylpolyglutamate synthase|nr:bifunctional folylpolyglutamate synthase/dihydrofolate synthase [Lactobacillaceae bacterium]
MFLDTKQAIEWIHSIPMNSTHNKDSLSGMKNLLTKLGEPQKKLPPVIHITGTNGKGSVAKFTQSLLTDMGFKVGIYVSPYIVIFNERIQIDGNYIDDEDLIKLTSSLKDIYENESQFEIITAIAILYFSQKNLDVAIFEVGIGGLFDSTNVLDADIAVITSIGLDHTEILGDTIEKIAFQKAGIIKQKTRAVVVGRLEPQAKAVIKKEASEKQVKFGEITSKVKIDRGVYQQYNAAVSWAVAKLFVFEFRRNEYFSIIDRYSTDKIIKLLNSTFLPARLEKIMDNPLVIIDGAHNQQGIEALVDSLLKQYGDKKHKILFGHLESHTVDLDVFKNLPFAQVIPVTFKAHKPSSTIGRDWLVELKDQLKDIKEDEMVVVTGSLYLVSQVRDAIESGTIG